MGSARTWGRGYGDAARQSDVKAEGMDRDDPRYFRPAIAWAAVGFFAGFIATYVATGCVVLSLIVGCTSAIGPGFYWYRLLTLDEPRRKNRRVDESRL